MGKMGSICHFLRALPASIWEHCSQVLVFTSIGAHEKGYDNDTFRAVFPSIWVSWDPQTLQNKGKRKMTNRPCFTPPHLGGAISPQNSWGLSVRNPLFLQCFPPKFRVYRVTGLSIRPQTWHSRPPNWLLSTQTVT